MLFKFAMKFPKKKNKNNLSCYYNNNDGKRKKERVIGIIPIVISIPYFPLYLLSFVHRTKTRKNGIREVREFHLIAEEFPWKFPFRGISKGNTPCASICALFEEPNKNFKAQTKEQ